MQSHFTSDILLVMAVYSGGSSGVWLIPRMSVVIHAADQTTDVAATILRMLYIKDLRGLQTIVDETLVNVQVTCILPCLAAMRC